VVKKRAKPRNRRDRRSRRRDEVPPWVGGSAVTEKRGGVARRLDDVQK
jgi:hypothetical protein